MLDLQVLSTECGRRNLLLTLIVRCVDNAWFTMQKSTRRRPIFLLQWRHFCYCCLLENAEATFSAAGWRWARFAERTNVERLRRAVSQAEEEIELQNLHNWRLSQVEEGDETESRNVGSWSCKRLTQGACTLSFVSSSLDRVFWAALHDQCYAFSAVTLFVGLRRHETHPPCRNIASAVF